MAIVISAVEQQALSYLYYHSRCLLITQVPEKSFADKFGEFTAGLNIYKKLEKKGLVLITEEDPDEDGFCFTPQIELLDEALTYL